MIPSSRNWDSWEAGEVILLSLSIYTGIFSCGITENISVHHKETHEEDFCGAAATAAAASLRRTSAKDSPPPHFGG